MQRRRRKAKKRDNRGCTQGEEEDSQWSDVGPVIHILNSGGEEDQVEGVPHMKFNIELGRYVKVEFEDRPGMPPSPSFSQDSFLNKLSHVQEGIQPSEQDAVANKVYQQQDRSRPQLEVKRIRIIRPNTDI